MACFRGTDDEAAALWTFGRDHSDVPNYLSCNIGPFLVLRGARSSFHTIPIGLNVSLTLAPLQLAQSFRLDLLLRSEQ